MPVTLLTTKLFVPPARAELVSRPVLLERLSAAMEVRLTLLSAPAGFGKTTLLGEWATTCGWPASWFSLEEGDNDPERFLAYLAAALRRVQPAGLPETVLPPLIPSAALEPQLTALLNGVMGVRSPFALVLDDYHAIHNPLINAGMVFLVEHLPVQMHLVVASRADPPWPLARLRARGELLELRTADLRFTPEESAAFLNEVMGLRLTPNQVTALEARTEGWIAGLQMAALSMRGRSDIESFLQSFTGSHHFVFDYLVEEVLDRQPPRVQQFLLSCSVLERMCAGLCEAVLNDELPRGQDSGAAAYLAVECQQILDGLAHANLFVTPLDDEARWFHCHPLFADLLRHRLAQVEPGLPAVLHRRASRWYEKNGLIADAVQHALTAGDPEWIAALVKGRSLSMLGQAELRVLNGWLDSQPPAQLAVNPWLMIIRAWIQLYAVELDGLAALIERAEASLESYLRQRRAGGLESGALKQETRRIRGVLALQRCYLSTVQYEPASAIGSARAALEHLSSDDPEMRCMALALLATNLRSAGDQQEAVEAARQAVDIGRSLRCSSEGLYAREALGYILRSQGCLSEARELLEEGLACADDFARRSGRVLTFTSDTHALLSVLSLEQNEIGEAVRHARAALELVREWGQLDSLANCCAILSEALQADGDAEGAGQLVREIERMAANRPGWFPFLLDRIRVKLWLLRGDFELARPWAAALEREHAEHLNPAFLPHYLLAAWAWLGAGEPARAAAWLDRLEDAAGQFETFKTVSATAQIAFLRALLLFQQGDEEAAFDRLKRALELAEPGGFRRMFIEKGAPGAGLMRAWLARAQRPPARLRAFASDLLAALEGREKLTPPPEKPAAPGPSLAETLTGRELDVLRLLASTLTADEIASQLYIAPSTVRTHIKNIYAKLGVARRMQAVDQARQNGLL